MVAGKKVVFGFAASMAVVAAIGLFVVIKVLAMPVAEKDQRVLSTQLTLAYQKYRFDNKVWPTNAEDAAEGFRSENQTLLDRVQKAEQEWGMSTTLIDPESTNPKLQIVFNKPAHFERLHALYKSGSSRSNRTSANY